MEIYLCSTLRMPTINTFILLIPVIDALYNLKLIKLLRIVIVYLLYLEFRKYDVLRSK